MDPGFTVGQIGEGLIMVTHIRVFLNHSRKPDPGRLVILILVVKQPHVELMSGEALVAGHHITPGHAGIGILRILLNQSLVGFQGLGGIGLIPVDRVDLVEIRTADAINHIRDGLVTRVELLELFVGKDGVGIGFQIEISIGNLKLSKNGIAGKRIPVTQFLKGFDGFFVFAGLIIIDTVLNQFLGGLFLLGFKPRAPGNNQQATNTGKQ